MVLVVWAPGDRYPHATIASSPLRTRLSRPGGGGGGGGGDPLSVLTVDSAEEDCGVREGRESRGEGGDRWGEGGGETDIE